MAFLGFSLVRTTPPNFPNPSILKLRNFCVFSLRARMRLLAVKRTYDFFLLPASKIEYEFVVCVKGTHDVTFVSS